MGTQDIQGYTGYTVLLDPAVFFDDLHLNNKIGTKRLVANIKSRIGLRREGNREQANRRQYNSSRLQNRRWNSR